MGKNRHKGKGKPAKPQQTVLKGQMAEINLTPIEVFQLAKIISSFDLQKGTVYSSDRWYSTFSYSQEKMTDAEIAALYDKFKRLTEYLKLVNTQKEPVPTSQSPAPKILMPNLTESLPQLVQTATEHRCTICKRPTANPKCYCIGDEVAGCRYELSMWDMGEGYCG